MLEGMVLDRPAGFPQRLEFRQPLDRETPPQWKTGARETQSALQILIRQAGLRCRLEVAAGREHRLYRGTPIGGTSAVMPARTSATCRASICRPWRQSLPAMLSRHPRSPARTAPASVATMSAAF